MSTDAGSPIPPRQPFSPQLPRLRSLRIRRVGVEPPALTHFTSSLAGRSEAIEFLAETDAEVPVRAYGPALFIGGVEVNQSERVGPTTWRFLAYEPVRLEEGAAIAWGWMKDIPSSRQDTQFTFHIEAERGEKDRHGD